MRVPAQMGLVGLVSGVVALNAGAALASSYDTPRWWPKYRR
jgi:hypothetical protein